MPNSSALARTRTRIRNHIHIHMRTVLRVTSNVPPHYRTLFTNTDAMKRHDPYATLGIQWGATNREVKDAFKKLARELHPDLNDVDEAGVAVEKFQQVKAAYEKIMAGKGDEENKAEEWRFRTWRKGDVISQERTDVAGQMRRRPIRPISLDSSCGLALGVGHPDGSGCSNFRNELLTEGRECQEESGSFSISSRHSNSVGTGINKWVRKKEYITWNIESNPILKEFKQQEIEEKVEETIVAGCDQKSF